MNKIFLEKIGAKCESFNLNGVKIKIFDKDKFIKYLIFFRKQISEENFKVTFNDIKLDRKEIITLPIIFFSDYNFNRYIVEFRKEKLKNLKI